MKALKTLIIILSTCLLTFSQNIKKNNNSRTLKPEILTKDELVYISFEEWQAKTVAKKFIYLDSCRIRELNYIKLLEFEKNKNILSDTIISNLEKLNQKKDTIITKLETIIKNDSLYINICEENEKKLKKELKNKKRNNRLWKYSTEVLIVIVIILLTF